YERAGRVETLGNQKIRDREGSLYVVGAVSPPGGDISDPVVQATLRIVKVFWSLEDKLAYKRHFPAINWLSSYSLYLDNIKDFLKTDISEDFLELRGKAMRILQEEDKLLEIARLVGIESLSIEDRLTLEIARSLREDFLHQNAFDPIDVHSSLLKQYKMLKSIVNFYQESLDKLKKGASIEDVISSPVRNRLKKLKFLSENEI
ncbi:V-type ATP synthase subunit A, partial [Candidatus Desantisbacteria bacterium CG07_land_8_20_14_0_80_39_15]